MNEGALCELPGGWMWTKLGEIAGKLQSGGTPSTKVKEFYEKGTIPFVKIEDMVNIMGSRGEQYPTLLG